MPRSTRLYEPTWWEKRFPWVRDFLIKLDPAPLACRCERAWAPCRAVIEFLNAPFASLLPVIVPVPRGSQSAWRGDGHRAPSFRPAWGKLGCTVIGMGLKLVIRLGIIHLRDIREQS